MKEFKDLRGKIIVNIENKDNKELIFTLDDGDKYKLYHDQDCCEGVEIDEIIGDLKSLYHSSITLAEEVINEDKNPSGVRVPKYQDTESFTWTFYKLATLSGYVTIRWYGQSNGYYSESVSWMKV